MKKIELNDFVIGHIRSLKDAVDYNKNDLKVHALFYSVQRQEEFEMLLDEVSDFLKLLLDNSR